MIKTIFQVCKRYDDKEMSEYVKLEFLKIIGFFALRISEVRGDVRAVVWVGGEVVQL